MEFSIFGKCPFSIQSRDTIGPQPEQNSNGVSVAGRKWSTFICLLGSDLVRNKLPVYLVTLSEHQSKRQISDRANAHTELSMCCSNMGAMV